MIPDAIVSCGYLLLGSGCCVYRLAKDSGVSVSKILPEFISASIGIAAIGARSVHALFYNLFWRSYSIDPMLIAKELKDLKDETNFIDWFLGNASTAAIVYSLFYRYELIKTGTVLVFVLAVVETMRTIQETASSEWVNIEILRASNSFRRVASFIKDSPFPPATFWILSTELLGRAFGNPLCRLANVPYAISVWAYPREGFFTGWCVSHTINDYAMLCYIVVVTEGLCRATKDIP